MNAFQANQPHNKEKETANNSFPSELQLFEESQSFFFGLHCELPFWKQQVLTTAIEILLNYKDNFTSAVSLQLVIIRGSVGILALILYNIWEIRQG